MELGSCRDIGSSSFSGCSNLVSLNGTNEVTSIGNFAFKNDTSLSTYSFPACLSVGNGAFSMIEITSSNKTNVEYYFPECRYIGDEAFAFYTNEITTFNTMSSIHFPSCEYIGIRAFYYSNTKNINAAYKNVDSLIFENCKVIGEKAFETGYKYDNTKTGTVGYSMLNHVSSLYFPSCLSIGYRAFSHNQYNNTDPQLKRLYFPHCIHIGDEAFKNRYDNRDDAADKLTSTWLYNLSSIDFPECEYIGSGAFSNLYMKSQVDVNFPECLSAMDKCFYKFSGLSAINISSCQYLGNDAFSSGSGNLVKIDLPAILEIKDRAFENFNGKNLTSISFGKNLSSIG